MRIMKWNEDEAERFSQIGNEFEHVKHIMGFWGFDIIYIVGISQMLGLPLQKKRDGRAKQFRNRIRFLRSEW